MRGGGVRVHGGRLTAILALALLGAVLAPQTAAAQTAPSSTPPSSAPSSPSPLPEAHRVEADSAAKASAPVSDPGSVLVQFKPGTTLGAAADATRRSSSTLESAVAGTPFAVVATDGAAPDDVVARLRSDPTVESAEPNYVRRAFDIPNDSFFSSSQGYLQTLHLPQAWSASHGSTAVHIAIVDTGVDLGDAEFAGRLLPGWNFVAGNNNPQDDEGHGTEVAGVAAAGTNNALGIAGTAWDASIIPVKVLDSTGHGTDATVAAGITWATDHGASIINLSLGGPGESATIDDAVAYAVAHDVVVIAAAGNTSSTVPQYPAADPGVLAVAATDASGDAAFFSEHGPWVDLAAPGINIAAPDAHAGSPTGFVLDSGTSFSSPIVAGIAVLVRAQHPTWSAQQVENWLEATATDRGPSGVDDTYGHGLVDAWAAVGGPGASGPGPAAGDASEPNDVPARATSLAAGQIRSATIAPEGDVDWYQISVPGAGSLTVTVTPPPISNAQLRAEEMDPVLEVYTADNRPLATADTGGFGAAETATIGVAPGTYHVSVRNFSGARSPSPYTLTSAFSTSVGPAGPTTDREWIRSTTPIDFSAGTATTTSPTVSFGRALNVSSVNANTVQLLDGVTGAPLPATLAYNAGAKSVTVTPAQPLETNHPYAVHVAGVSDLNANVFTDGYTFRFKSAGPPSFGVPVKSFYLRDENAPGPPDNTIPFGSPGCVAVTGDWHGNGTSTVGAYCGGTWYLRNSNTPGGADIAPFAFGAPGYTPVVGDWDGDGKDSIGVYVNGMWYLRNHDSAGAPEITPFAYGTTGYTPVVGNWDGAGGDGIGVFVNGAWYLRNAAGPGAPDLSFAFGGPGYRPVVGNWDGVGGDGVGVVVGSGWYLRNAASGGAPDLSTSYGDASYDLVPGDWNGDHITTIGVAT